MTSKELREKFLSFFEKRGHMIVPSSSLIPTDPSVLFTTAGMQQFKEYYLGKPSPYGKNAASCQKCFRTSDIEQVGDESHLTFLEMLGNFSFGGYFKEEAIELAFELVNSKFQIPNSKITVTVFGGDEDIPRDEESVKIWSKFGFSEEKGNLKFCGRKDNFWGPTGEEGPCGPTTEIYINGIEVWNLVFNEYYQDRQKKLTPLNRKGVDTGMGLERLAMVVQEKSSVFETDLFSPIITQIPGQNETAKRIIADHIKSAVFLASEGIFPSNVERGYVLRRVLRRAIRYGKILEMQPLFLINAAKTAMSIYKEVYPDLKKKEEEILTVFQNEQEKFEKTLDKGLKELNNIISWFKGNENFQELGNKLFFIYQTYGFPLELSLEEIEKELGTIYVEFAETEKAFQEKNKKHQEISRAGAEKKFGGGGEFSPALHTATHLLHAALRQILGQEVKQMGSDITAQRMRFDFFHPRKMTQEEIKKVEDLVNQKIKEDSEVKKEEMSYEEAIKSGALAFFKEKYPEKVSVYSVGDPSDPSGQAFSKEICAGPHVKRTSELGRLKIQKEESSGAGVRRIRAVLLR